MSAVGPHPPLHLRENEEQGPKHCVNPSSRIAILPVRRDSESREHSDGADEAGDVYAPSLPPDLQSQFKRTLGPSLPTRPPSPPHDDSDTEQIGPMPLPAGEAASEDNAILEFIKREERVRKAQARDAIPQKLEREEWMLVPPTSSGLLGSLDPTKLKARQFSRSAHLSQSTEDMSLWTESPQQRQARLKDEVLGKRRRAADTGDDDNNNDQTRRKRNHRESELISQIEDYNRRTRGNSLIDLHKSKQKQESSKKEDVVIWDHSRDMAIGGRLMDHHQRSKTVEDAHHLRERFSQGKSGFL